MTKKQREFKGYNGTLVLTDKFVIIKRGLRGFLLGGGMLRGDKTIPYSSIVAVQLKKAGLMAGYIQLTLKGGSEAKKGLFQAAKDENTINFNRGNEKFEEAKRIIEEEISEDRTGNENIKDLEKLAELKERGIITGKEFQKKKKQILKI